MNETFVPSQRDSHVEIGSGKFDITLNKMVKEGLNNQEWKSILFEICFGLVIVL